MNDITLYVLEKKAFDPLSTLLAAGAYTSALTAPTLLTGATYLNSRKSNKAK